MRDFNLFPWWPKWQIRRLSGMAARLFSLTAIICLCGCQFPHFDRGTGEYEVSKNPCVVLALPASGPYSPIAAKIRKGASLAREEMKTRGIDVRVENVNTESADWLNRLDALPEMCMVVGGPIQDKAYMAARKAGMLSRKVFFSFMSNLEPGDEGINAWRFFPSPQDQIDALTKFVVDDLNIRSFGSFYPSDRYGAKMTELLEKSLAKRHIKLMKATYNPGNPSSWATALKPLVQPSYPAGGKNAIPHTPFEALFLPDSWKNMDRITNALMENGEDRLVLLGPTLWEQSLDGKNVAKPAKYELAIFPVAWNKTRTPAPLKKAGNDFWTSLGFDFINFAVYTGIATRIPAEEVIRRAQRSSTNIRAMAPITWNAAGVAQQNLFIFQIGSTGMRPADAALLKQTRAAAMGRAALRMQNINEAAAAAVEIHGAGYNPDESQPVARRQEDEEPPVATPAPAPAPKPYAPLLDTTPRSSYKLSLPNKK